MHRRPQEDSHTAFPSAVPTEETGAHGSSRFSSCPRQRGAKRNIVHILGIAADEPGRVARYISKPGYLLPLVEADWHEGLCGLWCQYEDTLSPVYEDACRSGCWFCHKVSTSFGFCGRIIRIYGHYYSSGILIALSHSMPMGIPSMTSISGSAWRSWGRSQQTGLSDGICWSTHR